MDRVYKGLDSQKKLGRFFGTCHVGRYARAKSRALTQNRKVVSWLLKVVEPHIWAQNDRNGRVYISTYNNTKL